MSLTAEEGFKIVEKSAQNAHLYRSERNSRGKNRVNDANVVTKDDLKDIMKDVLKAVQSQSQGSTSKGKAIANVCGICSSTMHVDNSCPHNSSREREYECEDVNYMVQRQERSYVPPLSNNYDPNNRDHPNFSYKNQDPIPFNKNAGPSDYAQKNRGVYQIPQHKHQSKGNCNDSQGQQQRNYPRDNHQPSSSQEDSSLASQVAKLTGQMEGVMESNKMLTNTLAQQAQILAQLANTMSRNQGKLPSQPEETQMEHCNAVYIGHEDGLYGDYSMKEYYKGIDRAIEEEALEEAKAITLKSGKTYESPPPMPRAKKVPEIVEVDQEDEATPQEAVYQEPPPYVPPIPFPQRLRKQTKESKEYDKFVKVLKQLMVHIPFIELVKGAPHYGKFLKDILSNKRTVEEIETCPLNHQCSALFSTQMPSKVRDPGRFTIPCSIGDKSFAYPLADLGASVSIMPYDVYRELGLNGMEATRMTLQLADGTTRLPRGIIENVPVRVDKFYIPCDFVVMDVGSNRNSPIIFGRPFLATAGTKIEVASGRLSLEICGEVVEIQNPSHIEATIEDVDESPTRVVKEPKPRHWLIEEIYLEDVDPIEEQKKRDLHGVKKKLSKKKLAKLGAANLEPPLDPQWDNHPSLEDKSSRATSPRVGNGSSTWNALELITCVASKNPD